MIQTAPDELALWVFYGNKIMHPITGRVDLTRLDCAKQQGAKADDQAEA